VLNETKCSFFHFFIISPQITTISVRRGSIGIGSSLLYPIFEFNPLYKTNSAAFFLQVDLGREC